MILNASVRRPVFTGLCALFVLLLLSLSAVAQSDSNPKWDLFVGYQYLHPGTNVPAPFGDPNNPIKYGVPDMPKGFGSALTYNLDPHWGLELDFGHNWGSSNYDTTASVGPRFIWRTDGANFFAHTLFSYNRLGVNGLNNGRDGIGALLGAGMDLPLSKKIAFRVFEGDYVWARHNYADYASAEFPNLRRSPMEGLRLRTGLVFSWGGTEPVPAAAACTVQPTEVMVGEPITANVIASNFNPKHTVTYAWSGTGGQVSGKETSATIDTTNAAPGTYTVTAHVTDSRVKKGGEASCSAQFTVKPLPPKNPPTMSLSASPTSVIPGSTVTLTANCTSPDGVPVSVANWTSTAGSVSGTGNSATLTTAGASPGSATVTATCTDSRGLSSQGSAQVAIENPPPPPISPEMQAIQARLALHSIYYPTAKPTDTKPGSGLVPSQQKNLEALATDFKKYLEFKPDAQLTLEGHADIRGTDAYNQALTERRVGSVKSYLVQKGIPESAIETRAYGKQQNLTMDQVRDSIQNNPELTTEERRRALAKLTVIKLASNRRVDVTLKSSGQPTETSARQFPFNAADALSLIGGREGEMKQPVKKTTPKKAAPKKPVKK